MRGLLPRRLALMIPALLVITLIGFIVSLNTPGDPVRQQLQGSGPRGGMADFRAQYARKRAELGLHLPVFYGALAPLAVPDTLYKIPLPREREAAERLCYRFGAWPAVQSWRAELIHARREIAAISDSARAKAASKIIAQIDFLLKTGDTSLVKKGLANIRRAASARADLSAAAKTLEIACARMEQEAAPWRVWVPKVVWHGADNQYHRWLAGALTLDFGVSYRDGRPVTAHLADALIWTSVLGFFAILLSFGLGMLAGVFASARPGSPGARATTSALLGLYAVPDFWAATLLVIFFAGGDFLQWFPAGGVASVMQTENWSFGAKAADWAWHLTLPLVCLTYGSLAVIGRQTQSALSLELAAPYALTARAKGLSERRTLLGHALPNALLPVITLLGGALPLLVSGAIIVETVFAVPGMGYLLVQSVGYRDYPVLLALFTLGGFLTQAGVLLADLLYARADPRVRN